MHELLFELAFPNKTNPIPFDGVTGLGNVQFLSVAISTITPALLSPEAAKSVSAPFIFLMNQTFYKYLRLTMEVYGVYPALIECHRTAALLLSRALKML